MRPYINRCRGISLIEVLVVVAIIAIVMSMLLTVLGKVYHIIDAWRH
jgi:prepilin-type N-terminal cleavage/methylation domain-containing protein